MLFLSYGNVVYLIDNNKFDGGIEFVLFSLVRRHDSHVMFNFLLRVAILYLADVAVRYLL